jgi:hypothetical protein
MPDPREGESEKDFVKRCIPIVIAEGTAEDGSQAEAICHSMYQQKKGKSKMNKITDAVIPRSGNESTTVGNYEELETTGPMPKNPRDLTPEDLFPIESDKTAEIPKDNDGEN